MKTWEMIKELTENPKKKFKSLDGYEASVTEQGLLSLFNDVKVDIDESILILDKGNFKADDWTEVKQPVSLLEALQAWADGKTITCKTVGKKFIYTGDCGSLKDEDGASVIPDEILNGVWYIGEV